MATIVIAPAETISAVEIPPLSIPLRTYAVDHDRAERAEPSETMQASPAAGIRNRVADGRSTRVVTRTESNESSSGSSQTLTPSSFENSDEDQDAGRLVSPATFAWRNLFDALARSIFTRRTEEEKQIYDAEHGYDKFKFDTVDQAPEGFPQLAAFLNSDASFAVFRRFGLLSSRLLLQMEVDLTDLEKKLHDLDNADASSTTMHWRLKGFEKFPEWNDEQQKLATEIRVKLRDYFELLVQDTQIRALGQPPPRHHLGLFNWIWNNKPLVEGKDDFMFHVDDFVSASKHSETGTRLADFIEEYFDSRPDSPFKKFLQTEHERRKSSDPYVDHYALGRLKILVKAITVSLAVGILLIPVLLLFLVNMPKQVMAWIVFSFVLAFSITISVLTDAKVHEVLVGTAAYAAVLVTFLGNLNHGNGLESSV